MEIITLSVFLTHCIFPTEVFDKTSHISGQSDLSSEGRYLYTILYFNFSETRKQDSYRESGKTKNQTIAIPESRKLGAGRLLPVRGGRPF